MAFLEVGDLGLVFHRQGDVVEAVEQAMLLELFDVEEFKKHCLLNGLDDIALTMENEAKIADFEKGHKTAQPWLAG